MSYSRYRNLYPRHIYFILNKATYDPTNKTLFALILIQHLISPDTLLKKTKREKLNLRIYIGPLSVVYKSKHEWATTLVF